MTAKYADCLHVARDTQKIAAEVVTPEESLGTVIADHNTRRGQVLSLHDRVAAKNPGPARTVLGGPAARANC